MGLSNHQKYKPTKHFKQRAKERFGIEKNSLNKWIGQQVSSLTLMDNTPENEPRKQFISRENIIFVCDTQKFEYVTCFSSIDTEITNAGYQTIQTQNEDECIEIINQVINTYEMKNKQEYLRCMENYVDEFCQQIKQMSQSTELINSQQLDNLIEHFHIVKKSMKPIEDKTDFRKRVIQKIEKTTM